MDFKEKQAKLDTKKLPLVFAKHIVINSLGDVIYELFFARRNTETFHKRGNYLQQQGTGLARTKEDCYLLAKEYLPGIDYETVCKAIQKLYYSPANKDIPIDYKLNNSFCSTVNRVVHSLGKYDTKVTAEMLDDLLDKYQLNIYKNEAVQID